MITDASYFKDKNKGIAEIVIVGSGLAAMAVGYELENRGFRCILLESGTDDPSNRWNVKSEPFNEADYGTGEGYSQLHIPRQAGGGSNVWAGWCATLRGINLSRTDLPGYASWPLHRNDLIPYWRRAIAWLQVSNPERVLLEHRLLKSKHDVVIKDFGFSPPIRYIQHLKDHIIKSNKLVLVTGVTVDSLEGSSGEVKYIHIRSTNGNDLLRCKSSVVLAGGAVGNARILARSTGNIRIPDEAIAFIGKRLFEHPHCYSLGKVLFNPSSANILLAKDSWSGAFISIAPTEKYLQSKSLVDFNFQLSTAPLGSLGISEQALAENYLKVYGEPPHFLRATLGMEHISTEGNVVLDTRTIKGKNDGYLKLSFNSQQSVVVAAKQWLMSLGVHAWIESEMPVPIQAVGHLHGTTRMANGPQEGVVDRDCRVFGVSNLYISGSSVFPSSGFVNPTLTIVALGIRLANHLAEQKS